jgi:predicted Zn-dependent protease DUF2268
MRRMRQACLVTTVKSMGQSHALCVADTTGDLEALAKEFSGSLGADLAALWVSGYESWWPEVFSSYYRTGHGNPEHRGGAAQRLVACWRDWKAAAVRAHGVVSSASGRLGGDLVLAGELRYLVMVGVGDSNGWVTIFDQHPTLFLAVEVLPDAPYDEILVLHELVHVAHQEQTSYDDDESSVADRLLQEGLATALSARLLPGFDADEYLWFGRPDALRWRRACVEAWDHTIRQILAVAGSREIDDLRRFFGGTEMNSTDGVPGRAGYLVGTLGIERLLRTVPVEQLLGEPLESVSPLLLAAIQQIDPESPDP